MAAISLGVAAAGSAQAINVVNGDLWHVPEAISQDATPGNVPGSTPDVTFSVDSPFNFSADSATVGTWLGSSGAFGIVENTAGTLASLMDNGTMGTLLSFTGFVTVTTGQMFTVTHDDGLSMSIGGVDLAFSPGPTSAVTSIATYTGASGNQPFNLVYGECCGGPAVLQVDLPLVTPVPEPETYTLLLAGLAAVGWISRRRRRT
ncbi:MAG: PEP-CTERM sorting domain-containing protein [Caldimonas sp.]